MRRRLLGLTLAASFGSGSVAFAGESLLQSGARIAGELGGSAARACQVPGTCLARAWHLTPPPGPRRISPARPAGWPARWRISRCPIAAASNEPSLPSLAIDRGHAAGKPARDLLYAGRGQIGR